MGPFELGSALGHPEFERFVDEPKPLLTLAKLFEKRTGLILLFTAFKSCPDDADEGDWVEWPLQESHIPEDVREAGYFMLPFQASKPVSRLVLVGQDHEGQVQPAWLCGQPLSDRRC